VQAWLRGLHERQPGLHLRELLQGLSAWDHAVFVHGYRPAAPSAADLFTSMFLHAGFSHIAGNMLFLWIYGDNVEHRLGRLPYLLAYLGGGAAAALGYGLVARDGWTPMVGASGAISAVLGMYLVFFPRNRVKLLVFFPPFWLNTVLVPAWLVLASYLLLDNLVPALLGGGGGVAHGAHIGGFLAGLALALPLRRGRGWRPAGGPRSSAAELRAALAAGDEGAVIDAVRRFPKVELGAAPAGELVRAAATLGPAEGLPLLRAALGAPRPAPEAARLHLGVGALLLAQGQGAAAWQHLHRATTLDPQVGEEARRLLERVRDRR
jgi:membrane associated rhomboid family serine protease